MRRAARVDGNHAGIVKYLRSLGWSVADTSRLGAGFPDIVVGVYRRNFLFEIKDPTQPPSRRQLSGPEAKFHRAWSGQINIIQSGQEAERLVRLAIGLPPVEANPDSDLHFTYNPDPLEAK